MKKRQALKISKRLFRDGCWWIPGEGLFGKYKSTTIVSSNIRFYRLTKKTKRKLLKKWLLEAVAEKHFMFTIEPKAV